MKTFFLMLVLWCSMPLLTAERHAKWILLEINEEKANIIKHRDVEHREDVDYGQWAEPTMSHTHEHGTVSIYYHLEGRTVHRTTRLDPRVMIYEGQKDGELSGKIKKEDSGVLAVTVPHDASHLTVVHHSPPDARWKVSNKQHTLAIDEKFAVLAGSEGTQNQITDAIPKTVQLAGDPARHLNIVMVSGGFTSDEQAKFDAIVEMAGSFLSGELNLGSMAVPALPAPWDRYYPVVNVYSVFQPSKESGTSFPLDRYGNGGHPSSPGVAKLVNNNLDCAYGTENVKMLNCDHQKMLELASFSGAEMADDQTVIVGVANGGVYGGTAAAGKISIYSGRWKACDITDLVQAAQKCKNGYTWLNDEYPTTQQNMFLNVLIHEIGHAQGELSDEYSYNLDEPQKLVRFNCHWSSTLAVPWQHWIDSGEIEAPTAVCSYTNYFKPTAKRCLLGSGRAPEMCAACAETQTLAIMKQTHELNGPRCPRSGETLVIVENDEEWIIGLREKFFGGGVLMAKERFVLSPFDWPAEVFPAGHKRTDATGTLPLRIDRGDIATAWAWPGNAATQMTGPKGSITNPETYIKFTGKMLGVGEWSIVMDITDNSEFVKKSAWETNLRWAAAVKNMQNNATFRIKVVKDSDSQWGHCTLANMKRLDAATFKSNQSSWSLNQCPNSVTGGKMGMASYYCAICDPGKVCNDSFPAKPFEALGDLEAAYEAVETKLIQLVLPMGAGAVLGCILIGAFLTWRWRNKPHSVIPYPTVLVVCRLILLTIQFILLCASIAVVAAAAIMYNNLNVYGKTLAVAAIFVAAFLYLVAFFGFLGSWQRSKPTLVIAGILLLLLFLAVLGVTIVIFYIKSNLDNDTFVTTLQNAWINQIENNPKSMCRFQAELSCTGFKENCLLGLTSQCPKDCEVTNAKYANTCWNLVKGQVSEYAGPISSALIALVLVLFAALFLNWAQCCLIRRRKMTINNRLTQIPEWADTNAEDEAKWAERRAVNALKNLNPREAKALKKEFQKIDKDSSGTLNVKEMMVFYKDVLEMPLTVAEAEDVFRMSDRDGDGTLNFNEFILMHTNADDEEKKKQQVLADKRLVQLGIQSSILDQMYDLFYTADMDGSGKLQIDEMKLIFKKVMRRKSGPSDAQIQKFMEKVDKDNSGEVDFFECCQLLKASLADNDSDKQTNKANKIKPQEDDIAVTPVSEDGAE